MTESTNSKVPPAALDLMHMSRFDSAAGIEDIFCLATLVAVGNLGADATLWDSREYWSRLDSAGKDCSDCPYCERCLAYIINGG